MTGNIAATLGGVSMMMVVMSAVAAAMGVMMMMIVVAVMTAVMTALAWFHLALLQTEMKRQWY